jgi:c-di-GMP-binding flagellar brake protein YcgR
MDRRAGVPRRAFAAPVTLTRLDSDATFEALSVNISEGGMLLRSMETSRVGEVLRFSMPQFAGRCKVLWAMDIPGNPLVGVRFTSLDAGAKEALTEILETEE